MMVNSILRKLWVFIILLPLTALAQNVLVPYQSLKTSGARDITPFTIDGSHYIAVPQLATDVPNTPANMDGGNADVPVIIFEWVNGQFVEYQRIPGHGNEGTTFFRIGKQSYLATSSVHSGPKAPYNPHTYAKVYRWDGKYFVPVQQFFSFSSKSWYAFTVGKRHFLGLANGVYIPGNKTLTGNTNSELYEWDGKQFKPFQTFATKWGYGWTSFNIGKQQFLGLTDHAGYSTIYRWDGSKFVSFQQFAASGGRAFLHFKINDQDYLAFANINEPSEVYQWNGKTFVKYQTLAGLGGRNFVFFNRDGKHYLFRVNFITGSTKNAVSELQSPLYEWVDGKFKVVQNITTHGGVNAALFTINGEQFLGVANSLTKDLRFAVDSVIYKVQ